jgi:hypothetical protein
MVIVNLSGGMGNQMFQYALGRCLSLKYNTKLKTDLSFLKRRDMGPGFIYRDYDLDLFNVISDFKINPFRKIIKVNEPHFHYSQELINDLDEKLKDGKNILLNGYWQTPKYFTDVENIIRLDFQFKEKVENAQDNLIREMYNSIKNTNSVMINVRRADYLNTDFHGVMGNDFIMNGVESIKSKVDNPHFFIFSDDIEWCKENIKLDNMTIVDHHYKGHKFGYYLQLMSTCKHFIIPNSTFAWWAAWLNNSSEKIVIAPKQWFTDKNINTNDIIPSDWMRI